MDETRVKLVVITDPAFLVGEAEAIVALLEHGAWRVHVRKPGASGSAIAGLLEGIPAKFRDRLSLHDSFPLAPVYGLGGVHLNARNPFPPDGFKGLVSRSCHSFEEVEGYQSDCDYMFLSPVFDSISKPGYHSRCSLEEVRCATGVDWSRILALGGVCAENIGLVVQAGFGGAAVLGYIWEAFKADADVSSLIARFKQLSEGKTEERNSP